MPLEVADFAEDGYPREDDGFDAFGCICNLQDPMGGSSVRATYFCGFCNIMLCYTKGAVFLIYMGF